MKGYIARRNVSFKMTDVLQLTHDAMAAVTEDDWVSSCRHVEEVERTYWDADVAVKAEMEKIQYVDKSIRRSMTSPFKTVYFQIFCKNYCR